MVQLLRLVCIVALLSCAQCACPYSGLWMKYGPERAAEIIGQRSSPVGKAFRKLKETPSAALPSIGYGVCVYKNPFAGTTDCVQYSGSGFTDASAKKACDSSMGGMAKGVLTKNVRCLASTNAMIAGHCYTSEGAMTQAMPMLLSPQSSCAQVADSCSTWSQGRFVMGAVCSEKMTAVAGAPTANSAPTAAPGPVDSCTIAPGPMGAAHQHARSAGYRVDCQDAPAKNSPYQLPLKWKAETYTVSLPFDSTQTGYTTKGTVYYDFSRNYKRMDTFEVTGNVPFGFNGPVDDWTGRKSSTMLHRRDKMIFINYHYDKPPTCTYMPMMVGNIRPDWYMDGRGSATAVQFLGNQHIFHKGKPTLVKQWRKKDFADMYFIMSVNADKGKDGVHWPVQMNVPGEGFGDDGLMSYWNHTLLDDSEDDAFFTDKDLDCQPHKYAEGEGGPPDMDAEIPSNLNVDEAGWFDLEYTASPQGPSLARAIHAATGKKTSEVAKPVTPGVTDLDGNGELHVCENESGAVSVTAKFTSTENVWTSVGIRPAGSKCRMVPARVNVAHKTGDNWSVHAGDLVNDMRGGNVANFLSNSKVATGVEVIREGRTTSMSFSEPLPRDRTMQFSYAIGKTSQMSYHDARGCVSVSNIPQCSDINVPTTQVSVARREGTEPTGCEKKSDAEFQKLTEHITKLSSKLDDMTQPKCDQFRRMKMCNKWNIFCRWNMQTKKCLSL